MMTAALDMWERVLFESKEQFYFMTSIGQRRVVEHTMSYVVAIMTQFWIENRVALQCPVGMCLVFIKAGDSVK